MKIRHGLRFACIVYLLAHLQCGYSQSLCANALSLCLNPTMSLPAPTSTPAVQAQAGPDYGCLLSTPNPVWLLMQVQSAGTIDLLVQGTANNQPGYDVDFICWGPFSTTNNICNNLTAANTIDCSYSPSYTESCSIPNGLPGQYYMLMVTNFANQGQSLYLAQTGGTGFVGCGSLPCMITAVSPSVSYTPGQSNIYTLSGTVSYSAVPPYGNLIVSDACSGQSLVISPPFTSPTAFSFSPGTLPGPASSCSLSAYFTVLANCPVTGTYALRPFCSPGLLNRSLTDQPPAAYVLTGTFDFTTAIATGSLLITNSCSGETLAFTPPFTSPLSFSFTPARDTLILCSINAFFTAASTCSANANFTTLHNTTGIPGYGAAPAIFIYPTLIHKDEMIFISGSRIFDRLKLYGPDGKCLQLLSIENNKFYLDLVTLENSAYILELISNKSAEKFYRKIIVLKQ